MPQGIYCQACGKTHELPDDVFAKRAGKTHFCPNCGGRIQIRAGAYAPAPMPVAMSAAAPIAPAALAPAEAPAPPGANCWAEGKQLVILANTTTPDRCVRCNAPAGGYRKKSKFAEQISSHGGGHGIVALIFLVVMIVELFTRKKATVELAYCPQHRSMSTAVKIGIVALLLGSGVLAGGIYLAARSLTEDVSRALYTSILVAGCILFVIAIVLLSVGRNSLTLQKIAGDRVYLKRAGKLFLASLPRQS